MMMRVHGIRLVFSAGLGVIFDIIQLNLMDTF